MNWESIDVINIFAMSFFMTSLIIISAVDQRFYIKENVKKLLWFKKGEFFIVFVTYIIVALAVYYSDTYNSATSKPLSLLWIIRGIPVFMLIIGYFCFYATTFFLVKVVGYLPRFSMVYIILIPVLSVLIHWCMLYVKYESCRSNDNIVFSLYGCVALASDVNTPAEDSDEMNVVKAILVWASILVGNAIAN